MKNKAFIVGDIHGCYDELMALLENWHKESEQLIFLGDYIDRGKDSLAVVQLVQSLVENEGAIALKGNHEAMFIDWLYEWHSERFLQNGGKETIASFLGTNVEMDERRAILEAFSKEVQFLSQLPLYYEWRSYLFVHAGVNLYLSDWKKSKQHDLLWIRDDFHRGENKTAKTIIFGHTPVQMLHPEAKADPWFSPCRTKIGIDGGLVFGGRLHGLRIDENDTFTWYQQHLTAEADV